MKKEIDVVIPSFRLHADILQAIFSLPIPNDTTIHFFLVADNPTVQVPPAIKELASSGKIKLIVNETNIGFSKTRNKGMHAGSAEWILLLDDDIVPSSSLLFEYSKAIDGNNSSIGFMGVTEFPEPFNAVTQSLFLMGAVGHFQSAKFHKTLRWAPTANVMLNRKLLGKRSFNPELIFGGEDISLLTLNSFENNQQYIGVPGAFVTHPWWDNGKSQMKRMFRYGKGTADIIDEKHIKPYSYLDFSNTSESILILLLFFLFSLLTPINPLFFLKLIGVVLLTECFTCLVRSIILSGKFSLPLAWHIMLHKNASEAGTVVRHLQKGRVSNLFKRVDVGFSKPHPSPFRLNRWKIIKIISMIFLLLFII